MRGAVIIYVFLEAGEVEKYATVPLIERECSHGVYASFTAIVSSAAHWVASYPAFLRLKFLSIFHTVSDKNLRRGKAGYEATHWAI